MDLSRLPSFEKILVALEGQLLEGRIFQVILIISFDSVTLLVLPSSKQNCIEQIFDKVLMVSKNPLLQDEFNLILRQLLASIEPKLGNKRESDQRRQRPGVSRNRFRRSEWIGCSNEICWHLWSILSILSTLSNRRQKISQINLGCLQKSKELLRSGGFVTEFFLQVPMINLCGNVGWTPARFLMERIPSLARLLDKKALQVAEQQRLIYLQTKESSLTR